MMAPRCACLLACSFLQTLSALRTGSDVQAMPNRARADFTELAERNGDLLPNASLVLGGQSLQIVVGLSVAHTNRGERDFHRDTWFKSPLVCKESFGRPAGCVVLPRFILEEGSLPGNTTRQFQLISQEEKEQKDIAFVPGVLGDKTRQWIADAYARYPTADYIAKMDTDTYLSPKNLVEDVLGHRVGNLYYGYLLDGAQSGERVAGYPAEEECDSSTECCRPPSSCTVSDGFSGDCWVYAQGGFYMMARSIAGHLSSMLQKGAPAPMNYDCEDVSVGKWVQSVPQKALVQGSGTMWCDCDCLKTAKYAFYHMYYHWNKLHLDPRCEVH